MGTGAERAREAELQNYREVAVERARALSHSTAKRLKKDKSSPLKDVTATVTQGG